MRKWLAALIVVFGLSSMANAQTFSVGTGLNLYWPGIHFLVNVGDVVRVDAVGVDVRFLGNVDFYLNLNFCFFTPCSSSGLTLSVFASAEVDVLLTYNAESWISYLGLGIGSGYYGEEYRGFFQGALVGFKYHYERTAVYLEGGAYFTWTPFFRCDWRLRIGFMFDFYP